MFLYAPPFSDRRPHVVLALVADERIAALLADVLPRQRYEVRRLERPEDVIGECGAACVDALFVEGDGALWPQLKHVLARIREPPPTCCLAEPGEAAVFSLTLLKPVLPDHLIAFMNGVRYKRQIVAQEAVQTEDGPQRILVVEDNKTNQLVMRKILQNIGCTFEIAENGQEAIETLEKQSFDLVFMDCQMPVLDGIEATRRIRRSGKGYSSIPIVALTASAVEGDERTCREAGMDDYLSKPVRIHQIKGALGKFHH
jgi:CheY-like chemotaxis protein